MARTRTLIRSQSRSTAAFPSFLSDRPVVLLETKWARCKSMRCVGLYIMALVTSLSLSLSLSRIFAGFQEFGMCLCCCFSVDLSGRLPVERFLL